MDWANGSYKVYTSISEDNGSSCSELGVSELVLVLFAFLASDVETKQELSLSGNEPLLTDLNIIGDVQLLV